MVRLPEIAGRVPKQHRRDRPFGNSRTNHIRRIRSLLGMNCEAVVYRRIVGHKNRVGSNAITRGRRNISIIASFDFVGMRRAEYAAAITLDREGQPCQILQRMKLCLPRKMETWPRVKEF